MRRGQLWTVAAATDYTGKPRPALVVQADRFDATNSIVVCPLTSDVTDSLARVAVDPSEANGLSAHSRIMIDKITTVRRSKLSQHIGAISDTDIVEVNRSMLVFLGIT